MKVNGQLFLSFLVSRILQNTVNAFGVMLAFCVETEADTQKIHDSLERLQLNFLPFYCFTDKY